MRTYIEEQNVSRLYDRMRAACREADLDLNCVLIDDGSKDRTLELVCDIAVSYVYVRVLMMQCKSGKMANSVACIDHASPPSANDEKVRQMPNGLEQVSAV